MFKMCFIYTKFDTFNDYESNFRVEIFVFNVKLPPTETQLPGSSNKDSCPPSSSQKPGVKELNSSDTTPKNMSTNVMNMSTNVVNMSTNVTSMNTNVMNMSTNMMNMSTNMMNMSSTVSSGTITISTTSSKMDTTLRTPSSLSPGSQGKSFEKTAITSKESKSDVLVRFVFQLVFYRFAGCQNILKKFV